MMIRIASVPLSFLLMFVPAHAQSPAPAQPAGPRIYTGILEMQRLATEAAEARKKKKVEDDEKMKQLMGAFGGMGGGGKGGGGGAGGGGRSKNGGGESGEVPEGQAVGVAGSGRLDDCGSLPPQVEKAKGELLKFRGSCPAANTGGSQKFAINDYSSAAGIPRMYLFDSSGACYKSTSVSFGSGQGRAYAGKPVACADNGSHLTPPGFHLTVPHPKGNSDYGLHNSMGLAGLEGQLSKGRGILIHKTNNPGAGASWGCSGVSNENFDHIKEYLGYGALVYNNFDSSQLAPGCRSSAGMSHSTSCRLDPGASVPRSSGGGGGSSGGSGGGSGDGATAR